MDHIEYSKKGLPLLAGAFVYFLTASVSLLIVLPTRQPVLQAVAALPLISGVLLVAMSLPPIYHRPRLFRSLTIAVYVALGAAFLAFVARTTAVRGPFFLALLLALPLGYFIRRTVKKQHSSVSMTDTYFDPVSVRIAFSSVCGYMLTMLTLTK